MSLSWSFFAKVLRDTDKAKVFGCKEDMDTLLVFVRIARIGMFREKIDSLVGRPVLSSHDCFYHRDVQDAPPRPKFELDRHRVHDLAANGQLRSQWSFRELYPFGGVHGFCDSVYTIA